ncbi:MAG: transposase [Deltaproteobacteria bacterium]|nr:transposase [Deltaproteobacteria bacterium]
MARGIERRKIFLDDKDRTSFLERLALILEETQTQCYAWALIPNHFHILLRIGTTPLSTVMRRLMTGYAVTFNIRHRRSGHLFQNRYKSVVCEEDTYLLELTRYIHLNPLRARLVEDLKSLDKYQWACHSAILGRRKNPLIPALAKEVPSAEGGLSFSFSSGKGKKQNPVNPVNPACPVEPGSLPGCSTGVKKEKSLAEKTVEDVLQFFGKSLKEARRRYRVFVEKGIKHGHRTDLQGGGLIRSAGGDRASLIGQKKEDREKADQRVLGSGDFVSEILQHANEDADRKKGRNISMAEVISRVCKEFDIKNDELMLDIRRAPYTHARSIISYFSINELDYSGADVAKALNVSRASVSKARSRGEKLIDKDQYLWNLINTS